MYVPVCLCNLRFRFIDSSRLAHRMTEEVLNISRDTLRLVSTKYLGNFRVTTELRLPNSVEF
jgi:hypothetical protein